MLVSKTVVGYLFANFLAHRRGDFVELSVLCSGASGSEIMLLATIQYRRRFGGDTRHWSCCCLVNTLHVYITNGTDNQFKYSNLELVC